MTASVPCLTGCETLKIAKAALDRNPVEASNMMAMRDALLKVKRLFDGRIMFQQTIREAHEAVNAALAEPPRYCDVLSLEAARKVWFAQEIFPRLDGYLPLGKEVPFEEWFVSKVKQETKGATDEQK